MFSKLVFLFFMPTIFSFVLNGIEPKAGCTIDPFVQRYPPIVIPAGSREFLYPDYGCDTLQFAASQVVDIACPASNITVNGLNIGPFVQAKCESGTTFTVQGTKASWSDIECTVRAKSAVRLTSLKCDDGTTQLEIGMRISSSRFLRTMFVCFDKIAQGPNFSNYNLTATIGNEATGVPRPNWNQPSGIYTIASVNSLYDRARQRATINALVGLDSSSEKYIQTSTLYYLSRGHLSAKADFFFGYQQDATFSYVNTVPQWQTFNELNLERVESSLRNYADENALDLRVWTGGYGVTTLAHERTGQQVELYLYVEGNDKALPVPDVIWKVVYDPVNKMGVALLGVNNPYKTDVSGSIICQDVSDEITWVDWRKDEIYDGYSYACEIDDLRRTVKSIPELEVNGLLL